MNTSVLWLAVIGLGLYHGLNPAMGWPQAVAAGLAGARMRTTLLVAVVHTAATLLAGIAIARIVYRYPGLGFWRRIWLNLDTVWGVRLILAGTAGFGLAV